MSMKLLLVLSFFISFGALAFSITSHKTAGLEKPENTLEGFVHSLGLPVDYIELDLHMTKDGVLVLSHDPVLDAKNCFSSKTKKAMVIKETHSQEILKTKCFSKELRQRFFIPSFESILNAYVASGSNIKLNVEIKVLDKLIINNPRYKNLDPKSFHYSDVHLANSVLQVLRKYNLNDRILFTSFSPGILLELKKRFKSHESFSTGLLFKGEYAPKRLGLLVKLLGKTCFDNCWWPNWKETKEWLIKNKIDYFAPNWPQLTHPLFNLGFKRAFQKEPLPFKILPWTLNTEESWEKLDQYRMDGIITDRPSAYLSRR